MDITDFIAKIENEIEEFTPGTLKPETDFRKLTAWTSMHALIIIALIDAEYDVTINGEDLRKSHTISDLYNIVKSKK
ncbi:MAG TPA: acyl carrier protein [Bacteroidia bacterium]|nr:acyl carrier protein [Bacteroidia bacterium]